MNEVLTKIDEALKKNFPNAFDSLNPSATVNEIELLKQCFHGKKIPIKLLTLYKWHNGQSGNEPLNQNDNRTFLSILEVVNDWKFFNNPTEDILEPVSKSWIPIACNGAGDYLMLESEGINAGKLISYWHDDKRRDVEYDSLDTWAIEILSAAQDPDEEMEKQAMEFAPEVEMDLSIEPSFKITESSFFGFVLIFALIVLAIIGYKQL